MKRHFAIVVLAIAISLGGSADAKTKIYKSNTDLPFVEMMLSMMVAMGILDKIPTELIGMGGYSGLPMGYQNPGYQNMAYRDRVKQYLARRYLGNGYQGNRYQGNRYPGNRYQGNRYPGSGYGGLGGLYPGAYSGFYPGRSPGSYPGSYSRSYPGRYGTGAAPFYQNPMLGFPTTSPFRNSTYRNGYRNHANPWQPMRPSSCIEGSCLSWSSGSLNGLWINEDGEMLGIKNDQFLWSDGQDTYLSGLMNIDEDHVVANVDGSNQQISYDYRVQGNELLTRDESGVVRNFWRYQPGYQSGLPLY